MIGGRLDRLTVLSCGASTTTVCILGEICLRLGRPLKWDPVKQEFIDDEEANRLTSLPMREPWRV